MLKQYRRYPFALMGADFLTIMIVQAIFSRLAPVLPVKMVPGVPIVPYISFALGTGLLWLVVFMLSGVYRMQSLFRVSDHIRKVTPAHLLASMALAGMLFFLFMDMPRLLVLGFCGTLYVALMISRLALTQFLMRTRKGRKPVTVLIVGASATGAYLARTMMKEHSLVFRVAGFVDDDLPFDQQLPAPILGITDDVPRIVKEYEIDLVVVAAGGERPARVETLVAELSRQPVRIYVVSDLLKMALVHGEVERIGDLLIIGMREPAIQGSRRVIKRLMDISISAVLLLLMWPILIAIAVLIRLDSKGPVFYAPERVGEYGKIFRMYKFRSMYVDADRRQAEVAKVDEKGNIIYKTAGDPRITRVGKWLRRTSLDEIPQLWNVLTGEMSLVGPRPEQPFLTQDYGKGDWQRASVPPGITGWWQVRGRSDLPLHLNVEHDLYYVYNYSLLLDLKILFLTLGAVWRGKGAY